MTEGPRLSDDNGEVTDPQFRDDLYRGTARAYDEYRPPYPQALIDDLARRCGASGAGAMLDLACGTGQLSFALHGKFEHVWAVDLEPDMIALVRAKASAAGLTNLRADVGAAEDLVVPAGSLDLIALGNAFHRLPRQAVAAKALRWLRPGGYLALAWGGSPWHGDSPWQQALARLMSRWQARAQAETGDHDRIPPGYDEARAATPDLEILGAAGFELVGRWEFTTPHDWTPDEITGYLRSTSVLSPRALGPLAPAFEQELRRELAGHAVGGRLSQVITFACELARRPTLLAQGGDPLEPPSDRRTTTPDT
jgi:SAM-dependent methyltransferase